MHGRELRSLDQRDAQDASLPALRRSLDLLAAAHAEVAAGHDDGAQGLIDLIQREHTARCAELDAMLEQREAAGGA